MLQQTSLTFSSSRSTASTPSSPRAKPPRRPIVTEELLRQQELDDIEDMIVRTRRALDDLEKRRDELRKEQTDADL